MTRPGHNDSRTIDVYGLLLPLGLLSDDRLGQRGGNNPRSVCGSADVNRGELSSSTVPEMCLVWLSWLLLLVLNYRCAFFSRFVKELYVERLLASVASDRHGVPITPDDPPTTQPAVKRIRRTERFRRGSSVVACQRHGLLPTTAVRALTAGSCVRCQRLSRCESSESEKSSSAWAKSL